MRLYFDEDLGRVAVDLYDDGTWVRLRRPQVRQWCDWSDHATALQRRLAAAVRAAGAQPASGDIAADLATLRDAHDQVVLAGPQAALNWEMIRTLAAVTLPASPDPHGPLPLALADPKVTERLLTFWWNCPLAPWDMGVHADDAADDGSALAPPPTQRSAGGGSKSEPRKIGSQLPGGLGALSVMYQALSVIGMGGGFDPPTIDRWEIWQVAVVLGRDGPAGEQHEAGGELRRRADGQPDTLGFGRDPNQPRFFGPGASPKAAWDYIKRRRAASRRRAERAARNGEEPVDQRPARTARRLRWRKGPWRP